MRSPSLAVVGLLMFAACDPNVVRVPDPSLGAVPGRPAAATLECWNGWECEYAQELGPIDADPVAIGANCPEACDHMPGTVEGLYVTVDADPYWDDMITVRCPDNSIRTRFASEGCFDCRESCAGTACPPGVACVTIRNQYLSDCRKFTCQAGWEMYFVGDFQVPRCKRQVTTAPPPAAPVTSAETVNGNPRIAWSAASGAAYYRVYRQLEYMSAPEVWYTALYATSYTDGSTMVSGNPTSSPSSKQWARYHVVSVNSSGVESGYVNAHYYPYTGLAPY